MVTILSRTRAEFPREFPLDTLFLARYFPKCLSVVIQEVGGIQFPIACATLIIGPAGLPHLSLEA